MMNTLPSWNPSRRASYVEAEVFAYMTGTPEEVARRFEEQARVQQVHHEMLQAQQESINNLKKMIALLLDKQKKKTPMSSRLGASFNKGKEKGENSNFEHSDGNKNNFWYGNLESSSEELKNSEAKDNHAKRMSELEKRLEAITHRGDLQEVGVVRLYPAK